MAEKNCNNCGKPCEEQGTTTGTGGYLDKEAVLKAFKEEPLEFYNRFLHGEFDVPEMCCHRQNERDRLLKAVAEKDAEIARLKSQIAGYHEAIEVLRESKVLETALKSLKEEVAAIPRPPKDRENYYEIDLGPGFEKISISKNSVYPVPDQDVGGKKE